MTPMGTVATTCSKYVVDERVEAAAKDAGRARRRDVVTMAGAALRLAGRTAWHGPTSWAEQARVVHSDEHSTAVRTTVRNVNDHNTTLKAVMGTRHGIKTPLTWLLPTPARNSTKLQHGTGSS
jgi:hypothetical protein